MIENARPNESLNKPDGEQDSPLSGAGMPAGHSQDVAIPEPEMSVPSRESYDRVWTAVLAQEGDRVSKYEQPKIAILNHANIWASAMDTLLEDGSPLSAEIISIAYHIADNISQLSASMDNLAAIFIKDVWEHGEQFKALVEAGHPLFLSPPGIRALLSANTWAFSSLNLFQSVN